ncbi:MAG: OmpA family protein [Pseudomonadota bacterium]
MSFGLLLRFLIGGIAAIAFGSAAVACTVTPEDVSAATGDPDTLMALHAKAERDCSRAIVDQAAKSAGIALFNKALKQQGSAQLKSLEAAAGYSKDWRILAALGQVQLQSGQPANAARNLQAALVSLQDDPPSNPPPKSAVKRLITMANNARSVSPTYVRSLKTRSGDPGGVAAKTVAGVEIEVVPFPIEFVFGTSDVTETTRPAVADLAEILTSESASAIVLAGHTDPVGSDAANMTLSLDRANAIRSELIRAGLGDQLTIDVVGCGEASPPEIDSPELYSQDEIHQIMRRVELVRSGEPCR